MQPLVTILTPTYNCARFLPETIESVLSQDYKNIEYIVLDDGSTDNTQKLLERYKGYITIVRHANMGEHRTINEGLKRVRGKYFMYPNADDPLYPGAISELVRTMEANPDVLCAYPDWDSLNEDGSIRAHITTHEWDFAYMVRCHTCIPSVGSMFRSTVIENVGLRDPQFHWVSDFDYWLRIGLAGPMKRVPKILASWRNRTGQCTKDKCSARALDHIHLMRKFYALPGIPDFVLNVKREAMCWANLVSAAVTDNKKDVAKYLATAITAYPKALAKWETWETIIRRANYILRR